MFKKALVVVIGWAALAAAGAHAQTAGAPSFSCAAPSQIEGLICHDAGLAAADRQMAVLYQATKSGAQGTGSNQPSAQRAWLKDRDTRCGADSWRKSGSKSQRDCVADAYNDRLKALAVAALIGSPRLALDTLHHLDPKSAPYYDALLAYATIDSPRERAKIVEAKLAPLYAQTPALRDDSDRAGKHAATAADAASSDAGFAEFFDIASMENDSQLVWPCAALIKRPGLVAGLGAIWGGAVDSQVPGSDCATALPAPAEINLLDQAAFEGQPPCEGSIRFSTGRNLAMLEDAVRLRRPDIWRTIQDETSDEEDAFRRDKAALIHRTAAALTAYYARYWPSKGSDFAADGKAATDALVSAAFNLCQ